MLLRQIKDSVDGKWDLEFPTSKLVVGIGICESEISCGDGGDSR